MMRWFIVQGDSQSIYWSFQEKLKLGYSPEDQSETNMQISV